MSVSNWHKWVVSAAGGWWREWYGDAQTHSIWKWDVWSYFRSGPQYTKRKEPHSLLSEGLYKAFLLRFPRLWSKPRSNMNVFRGHYICALRYGLQSLSDDSVEGIRNWCKWWCFDAALAIHESFFCLLPIYKIEQNFMCMMH